jgi:hypothetical protein
MTKTVVQLQAQHPAVWTHLHVLPMVVQVVAQNFH